MWRLSNDDFAAATGADNTVAAGSVDNAACATIEGFMNWRLLTWLSLKFNGGYKAIYHPCFY